MRTEPLAGQAVLLVTEETPPEPASGVPGPATHPQGGDDAWIVTYECKSDQRTPDDDSFIAVKTDQLIDHLPIDSHPVVSAIGTAIQLTFQVIANATTAIPMGVAQTWTALEECGLPDYRITRAAQISLHEHEQQRGSGQHRLNLLNASDCARELEITRQRVAQLIDAGAFPIPAGVVGRSPVWFETDIVNFKARRTEH